MQSHISLKGKHPTLLSGTVRIKFTFARAVMGPRWISCQLCLCLRYLKALPGAMHGRRPPALRALYALSSYPLELHFRP